MFACSHEKFTFVVNQDSTSDLDCQILQFCDDTAKVQFQTDGCIQLPVTILEQNNAADATARESMSGIGYCEDGPVQQDRCLLYFEDFIEQPVSQDTSNRQLHETCLE